MSNATNRLESWLDDHWDSTEIPRWALRQLREIALALQPPTPLPQVREVTAYRPIQEVGSRSPTGPRQRVGNSAADPEPMASHERPADPPVPDDRCGLTSQAGTPCRLPADHQGAHGGYTWQEWEKSG